MKIKVIGKFQCLYGRSAYTYCPGWDFTSDPDCRDYDWLVGFEDMPSGDGEILACPRERTIFITWEPISVKRYSSAFTRQFGHLLTNRPACAEGHPHYHFGKGYFPWFIERTVQEIAAMPKMHKTRLLSTVCSDKQMSQTMHHKRFVLTAYLKQVFPEMDWFGRGVRNIENKSDALDLYKYHIAVENHIASGHWTEKIADPILCECLTFYAGDPDLGNVLPSDSFIPIPIADPVEAARIIRTAISAGEYEKRLPAIMAAKRLLLEKYNFHAQIIRVIESCADQPITPTRRPIVLYSRKTLRWRNPCVALSDGWYHLVSLIRGGR